MEKYVFGMLAVIFMVALFEVVKVVVLLPRGKKQAQLAKIERFDWDVFAALAALSLVFVAMVFMGFMELVG